MPLKVASDEMTSEREGYEARLRALADKAYEGLTPEEQREFDDFSWKDYHRSVKRDIEARRSCRLYHVVQRLPKEASVAAAHYWGRRLCSIPGMRSDSRYVLEQCGTTPQTMGEGVHVHVIAHFSGTRLMLQRNILKLKITLPNLTEVRAHDSELVLELYLKGGKGAGKASSVACDRAWRENNNIKLFYSKDGQGESFTVAREDGAESVRDNEGHSPR